MARVLTVEGLRVVFPGVAGDFPAVRDVSLHVDAGEILGVVGESGAGKSTVGRALMGLLDYPGYIAAGRLQLGRDTLTGLDKAALRAIRGTRIGMILQESLSALNPVLTVGFQLIEAVEATTTLRGAAARARVVDLLRQVEIPDPERRLSDYPHQFSGGMRQRVVIAIALAGEPPLLIADEPTTALDVSVQAGVLSLLQSLCRDRRLGIILVTHDMAVISQVADRVAVMRDGVIVESGPAEAVLRRPQHPYTQALVRAVPPADRRLNRFVVVGDSRATAPADRANAWLDAQRGEPAAAGPAVSVDGVSVDFSAGWQLLPPRRRTFRAVDKVSLEVAPGESFGIVGESGSGKSTLAYAIMGLVGHAEGRVAVYGKPVPPRPRETQDRHLAETIQIIFQDPFSSLQPRMRVGAIVAEPLIARRQVPRSVAHGIAEDLLVKVGLPADAAGKLPHQFSGGQRQRISIARALIMRPRILVCDEPTSALDVSVQAQILNLLKDLQDEFRLTLLFISHDLAVIRQMCGRVAVMRGGRLCEVNGTEVLFENPTHDYTRQLLRLMPRFAYSGAQVGPGPIQPSGTAGPHPIPSPR